MTSIPLPATLYRRPALRLGGPEAPLARPFRRRRRTIRSLREHVLCDPRYSRQHIL